MIPPEKEKSPRRTAAGPVGAGLVGFTVVLLSYLVVDGRVK
jgi:hypothetical protein